MSRHYQFLLFQDKSPFETRSYLVMPLSWLYFLKCFNGLNTYSIAQGWYLPHAIKIDDSLMSLAHYDYFAKMEINWLVSSDCI
ncbi:MAG: hypothetical protein ACTSVI_01340 [Promethearchaeota archaeon]